MHIDRVRLEVTDLTQLSHFEIARFVILCIESARLSDEQNINKQERMSPKNKF